MASLPISFVAPTPVRVYAATAKGAAGGGSKEEKSLLDWVLGNLTKEDQFYETDPILQKTEDKTSTRSGTGTSSGGRKGTVSVPQKKKNGGAGGVFGGLFAKK